MGSPAPGFNTEGRQRPTPDPIRGTPQAMLPVAEELVEDPPGDGTPPKWVMAESAAIAILRKHYGWTGLVAGHLVKLRRPTDEIGSSIHHPTPEAVAS